MVRSALQEFFQNIAKWQLGVPSWISWVFTGFAILISAAFIARLIYDLVKDNPIAGGKLVMILAGMATMGIGSWNIPGGIFVGLVLLAVALSILMLVQIFRGKGRWFATFIVAILTLFAAAFIYANSWDIIHRILPWLKLDSILWL